MPYIHIIPRGDGDAWAAFRAPDVNAESLARNDAAPVTTPRPDIPSTPRVWGDQEAQAAGLYEKQGDPWAAFKTQAQPAPQAAPQGATFDQRTSALEPQQSPDLQAALTQRATAMQQGPATSPAQNMDIGQSNILPAATQGTSPNVSAYGGRLVSKEVFQSDSGEILYRDPQTGQVKPTDTKTQVAIRDPADGVVKIFDRSEATNEGGVIGVARVLAPGMAVGAPTARPAIALANQQTRASDIFSTAKPYYKAFTDEASKIALPADHIQAYHGSPHSFDAFSNKSIGTGEGAQSYGHGLYFAENPQVAKSYAPYSGDVQLFGKPFKPANSQSLYQVNIRANKEHFLDWDKTYNQQTQQVRDAIDKLPAGARPITDLEKQSWSGARIANRLREQDGADIASSKMNDAGIPGIKYLDQGSRNAGSGTRNYVVFDSGGIKITHKNGEPFASSGGPSSAKEIADRLRGALDKANFIDELARPVYSAIGILDKGEPITLDKLQNVKRVVGRSFNSPDKNVRDAAAVASGEINKIISEVSPSAGGNLKTADQIHSTARSAQELRRKEDIAGLRAGSAGYGGNSVNSMRQLLKPIVQKSIEGKITGFKPGEVQAMREIVEGTATTNFLRGAGQFSPTKGTIPSFGGSATGATIGAFIGGPVGAAIGMVAIPGLGAASNKLATILTTRQIDRLREVVAKRSPAYAEAVSKSVQRYEKAQSDFVNDPKPNRFAAYISASRALSGGLTKDGIQITSGDLLKAIRGPMQSAAEPDQPPVPWVPGE